MFTSFAPTSTPAPAPAPAATKVPGADAARLFADDFGAIAPARIADDLARDGYHFTQAGLAPGFMDALEADVRPHRFSINSNWAHGVYFNRQYYLTHMLACSQNFFDLVTSPLVMRVCEAALGPRFRLKAMRYYETYGWHQMQWHTDNKIGRAKVDVPGLIFVAYLSDVADGELQYVRGSHVWSGADAYADYSESFIDRQHGQDVLSLKGPRGSIAVYNSYGIHRARPCRQRRFVRKSLFFQVDSDMASAEPLMLNPSFVHDVDPRILAYLGFGAPTENTVYPASGLATLPVSRLPIGELAPWLLRRAGRALFDASPSGLKNTVRSLSARLR